MSVFCSGGRHLLVDLTVLSSKWLIPMFPPRCICCCWLDNYSENCRTDDFVLTLTSHHFPLTLWPIWGGVSFHAPAAEGLFTLQTSSWYVHIAKVQHFYWKGFPWWDQRVGDHTYICHKNLSGQLQEGERMTPHTKSAQCINTYLCFLPASTLRQYSSLCPKHLLEI